MNRVIAVAALAALTLTGCSSSGGGTGSRDSGSITVDAASSLTEAFNTIKSDYVKAHPKANITVNYGASSDLSTQISQGAPVDVFASASEANMTSLGNQALHPTNFVSNTLEIATPPGNSAHIGSVAGLARPGVKVAVCDAAVPCGVVAAQVFENAGVTVTPVASEPDVKSVLAAVESGEVDAGLVYVTDVRAAGGDATGVAIPPRINASTTYPIAALTAPKNPGLAKAFVDYVLSPAGKRVLTRDGFSNP